MRKIVSSLMLLVLLTAGMFSLSGCGLLPYYWDPKSITIDDKEYISGFYNGLYLVGIEFKEFSSSLFTSGNHHWWHLYDSTFDMYYCRHKDSLNWFPTLYCNKDQFDEVKDYYHNTDNFDYYLAIHLEDGTEKMLTEDVDKSIIEQAVSLIVDVDSAIPSKKYKRANFDFDGKNYIRPSIYRRSKDGLFTTTRREFIYYENNIYVRYVGGILNGSYNALVLDDDVNAYIVSLLKEYGIV